MSPSPRYLAAIACRSPGLLPVCGVHGLALFLLDFVFSLLIPVRRLASSVWAVLRKLIAPGVPFPTTSVTL
jgi:hypothetical protein